MTTLVLHALLALPLPTTVEPTPPPVIIRHDGSLEEAVELAKRFDATVQCIPDGSGTLIDRRWVATAAHVAHGLSPFSPKVLIDGKERRVRQVIFHPESQSNGMRPPQVDLALLELEEEVEGIEPVALYPEQDEQGRAVTVVGYGDFGLAGTPFTRGDGTRRAAQNTVEQADPGRLRLLFNRPPEGTPLEGVGGPGDSGGPLYLETKAGLFLAGVSSGSMGGRPGSYGVTDIYVRMSSFQDWVTTMQKEAADQPPARAEIVDVTDGFPEGERGELVTAFFEVFNLAEEDMIQAFGEEFRSQGARRRNPASAFAQRMLRLATEHGPLTPHRLAMVDPREWIVLAESDRGTWHGVHLRLAPDGDGVRLADYGVRPEEAPEESGTRDAK